MKRTHILILSIACVAILASCTPISKSVDLCALIEPIYISRDDILTEGTAQQILDHNVLWEDQCS